MLENKKIKISMNVPEELYFEYKKKLIDLRTKTTNDVIEHLSEVVRHSSPSVFESILASDGDNLRFILSIGDGYKFVNIALYSESERDNEGNIIKEVKESYTTADVLEMLKNLEDWNEQEYAEIQVVSSKETTVYEYISKDNALYYKGRIKK